MFGWLFEKEKEVSEEMKHYQRIKEDFSQRYYAFDNKFWYGYNEKNQTFTQTLSESEIEFYQDVVDAVSKPNKKYCDLIKWDELRGRKFSKRFTEKFKKKLDLI